MGVEVVCLMVVFSGIVGKVVFEMGLFSCGAPHRCCYRLLDGHKIEN